MFTTQQRGKQESQLETDVVAKYLHNPENATYIVHSPKKDILRQDYDELLSESLSHHPLTKLVATVAVSSSWRWLWDMALPRAKRNSLYAIFIQRTEPPVHWRKTVKYVTTL